MTQSSPTPIEALKALLDAGELPQVAYDAAVSAMQAQLTGNGAIAQGEDTVAVGQQGVAIEGANSGAINTGKQFTTSENAQLIYAEEGATIVIGDAPVKMTAVDRETALGKYLQHLISHYRYLQLQGLRSGGKLVNIELDRIYVTLRATGQHAQRGEMDWLVKKRLRASGEAHRENCTEPQIDTTNMTVNAALADHKRLVVLGDPGSGKTTLLRYLTLLYARDMAEGTQQTHEKLELDERGALPIFIALRQIGSYLKEHHTNDDGTEGHALLLQFLVQTLKNERIAVPTDFFDQWLQSGRAIVLLDGLDEVADSALRRRVSRLVDAFTRAYAGCRYVVTCRIVGYTDTSRLNEGYATTTVRDFTLEDVTTFLSQWHRLVAIGQMGHGDTAEAFAAHQTRQLLDSIEKNDRVRELAINPLMLTVIALIHRDRVKLPDRRAELYQEAVEVLLGKWDEARGVQESLILNEGVFDVSDRRLVLQHLALTMHEQNIKEIDLDPLRNILAQQLGDAVSNPRERDAAVARFLHVIQERTGLLIARAEGTYAFSHLTFQEYLAALSIAGRDDYVEYTLRHTHDEWWREVILLEAGYLSTQGKEKTTRLIRNIAEANAEPVPYHNLVLAAECVRDAGANRIVGNLGNELRSRLMRELEPPVARGGFASLLTPFTRGISAKTATKRRIAAAEALGKIGGNQFWSLPDGEPEWITIPQGEFNMGGTDEAHRVHLLDYAISRVPITNAQYHLFVQASGVEPPEHWNGKRPPRGKESHPVVKVSWHDALNYCRWLSAVTHKTITLPSDAEWEKAARGTDDTRTYPWGNALDASRCNVEESGFHNTTPVGTFINGASPFGCLDMAGNVWEWTRSPWKKGAYKGYDFIHEASVTDGAVVRGGSWYGPHVSARCASSGGFLPVARNDVIGFRVVLRFSPVSSEL